ncbi:SDR family NAD(P)-dependent oxidoreductase [Streptomyces sp. NPDC046759]|uniref:SDR family NAD(P)-dependent oxidoreductase n=1 Tax=Streptomyces sp. NPDC046759 TaxID=3155019 RepID=UPI0033DCA02D
MSHDRSRAGSATRARWAPQLPSPADAAQRIDRGPPAFRGTALVTGALSGFGAAVARRLSIEGGWHHRGRLERVADQTSATAFAADLSRAGADRALSGFVLEQTGPLDLLVACAGVGWAGQFTSMLRSAIDDVVAVDLLATRHVVRRLVPSMVAAGSGRIVLIGSVAGSVGVRGEVVYSAAKAGLAVFADTLRHELRGTGVGVSHVIPGVVDTRFFERRGVPYLRTRPRPVSSERVADAVWKAVRAGKEEVFVPSWLRLPARVRGAAPGLFRRLAAGFG